METTKFTTVLILYPTSQGRDWSDDNGLVTVLIKKVDIEMRREDPGLETDWSSLHKILSDTTRRSILQLLSEKEALSYTEIMTLLQITNTGRLNYHLKSLGNLLSKDDIGRYHLTEQGRLAASLVKTFPERVTPERKLSALKVAAAVVLILVGILLIAAFAIAVLGLASLSTISTSTSETGGTSSQVIPQNTTIYLMSWSASGNPLSVAWSATNPVHLYVLNQTQYGNLVLQHSTGTQILPENFTGAPRSWVSQYYLQSGNVSLSLQPSQYYFFAGSQAQTFFNGLTVSQLIAQHQQSAGMPSSNSFFLFLVLSVFIAIGAVLVILGVSILTRRVWR